MDALFLCYSLTRSRWDVSVAGAGLVLSAKRGLVYIISAVLHRLLVPFLHSGSWYVAAGIIGRWNHGFFPSGWNLKMGISILGLCYCSQAHICEFATAANQTQII